MTANQKRFLLTLAANIKTIGANPVSTYMNRDDYYLLADLDLDAVAIAPHEMRGLKGLVQHCDYGRFDTVIRITKKGWQVATDMAIQMMLDNGATVLDSIDMWENVGWAAATI